MIIIRNIPNLRKRFAAFLRYHRKTKPIMVNASVEYSYDNEVIICLNALAAKIETVGYGSAFMKRLVKFADDNDAYILADVAVHGWQVRKGFKATNRAALERFYMRYGFMWSDKGEMMYIKKPIK